MKKNGKTKHNEKRTLSEGGGSYAKRPCVCSRQGGKERTPNGIVKGR